jgi:hypothetical protein
MISEAARFPEGEAFLVDAFDFPRSGFGLDLVLLKTTLMAGRCRLAVTAMNSGY